jgi:hypothetical protein
VGSCRFKDWAITQISLTTDLLACTATGGYDEPDSTGVSEWFEGMTKYGRNGEHKYPTSWPSFRKDLPCRTPACPLVQLFLGVRTPFSFFSRPFSPTGTLIHVAAKSLGTNGTRRPCTTLHNWHISAERALEIRGLASSRKQSAYIRKPSHSRRFGRPTARMNAAVQ